jgi:DNA adenine methylase
MKSIIKWVGGKSKLCPDLEKYFCRHLENNNKSSYVDLFCGSLAFPLYLKEKYKLEKIICNDANRHLIEFWQWVQSKPVVKDYPNTDEKTYYEIREKFNQQYRAKYFYYLVQVGFNSLCRYNKSGEFNVPHGKTSKGEDKQISFTHDFYDFGSYISDFRFYYRDCFDFLKDSLGNKESNLIPNNSFVYCDPPYFKNFSQYTKLGFDTDCHAVLIEYLKELHLQKNCTILISNSNEEFIINLYKSHGFTVDNLISNRGMGKDKKVKEIVGFLLAN